VTFTDAAPHMALRLADQLGALPFLPAGKGSLILILGGLAVLPISLMWSRMASGTQWCSGLEHAALRLGLGPAHTRSADERRCFVVLTACPTCQTMGMGSGRCERERRSLQLAIVADAPEATVVEVACNPSGHGDCTFEVRRGRSA
jgi:hypothetical protein